MDHAPTASPPTLAVADLCLWRGERCLVDGLGFRVAAGEALWLRGANGVGKTSLLRVLAGLVRPERGAIAWRGRDPWLHAAEFRAELLFVGHLDALKRALSARENLAVDGALRGSVSAAAVEVALAALGVAAVADLPVAQLSAGQRRRVALARLALSRAALWLLDEPTTNLDADGQGAVASLVAAHLAGGGLAVIASHLPLQLGAAQHELELAPLRARAA